MRAQVGWRGREGGVGRISWWYLSQVTPPLPPLSATVHPVPPTQSHQDPPGMGGRGGESDGAGGVVVPLQVHWMHTLQRMMGA